MITIHIETESGQSRRITVPKESKLSTCKEILNKGYYLVGESIPNENN